MLVFLGKQGIVNKDTTPLPLALGTGAAKPPVFFSTISGKTMADRTIVYVDGFNLYYLALRSTIYKWLDLYKLAETLLPAEYHDIVKVKFFTARINSLPNDPDAPNRQNIYLKALKAYRPDKIEIVYGKFLSHNARRPYAPPNSGYANVVLTEEKGTDVNLAVHLLNDAWMNAFDCAVVVSNDSDLAEAMRLAKARNKKIGWIVPETKHQSQVLKSIPHFIKQLRASALAYSQLPYQIPGTNIIKPQAWDVGKKTLPSKDK